MSFNNKYMEMISLLKFNQFSFSLEVDVLTVGEQDINVVKPKTIGHDVEMRMK